MPTNHDLLATAVEAAGRAAEFIRTSIRPSDPSKWSRKGVSDFVTDVDRQAERIVAAQLLTDFPDSVIVGEELSPDASSDNLRWVVDPIDGTTNYLHDYPAFAVSIAAVEGKTLRAAVVVDVPHDRVYTAVAEGGARSDGRPLNISPITDPAAALIGTGFPFKAPHLLPPYLRQFGAIIAATSGVRRAGSAALDLVDVALGRFEGFWELHLAPWDVAAGTLIVREAGGMVTDTAGSPDVLRHGSIVAGNPAIHSWLLGALADAS